MSLQYVNAVIANFRLTDLLGAGGMGEVYRGVHVQTGQVVALKVFSANAIEARELARFYHEARVHKALRHPNIVELHELVTFEGRPCLVMEYVDGESLADRIRRGGRLRPDEALRFFRDLAGALAHVHALGIVHRDIKPANVRITRQGMVKLLDFGIAQSEHMDGLTKTGHIVGTPHYLSPEQLFAERITPASDIWALGTLLYEMATGCVPFDGDTSAQLFARIDTAAYMPPSRVAGAALEDRPMLRRIDTLVKSCLVRDPTRRVASAAILADRANAALASMAVTDKPHPPAAALDALARSWPWLAGAAAIAFVAVVWWSLVPRPGPTGEPAVVHIDVVEGQAEVFVNGRNIGLTPVDYHDVVGQEIVIDLRQQHYETARVLFTMTSNGNINDSMHVSGRTP
jgi:serine/threonine protein kinase